MTTVALATSRTFREATRADLPRLCELFERFRSESIYAQYGPAHPEVSTTLIERLVMRDDGVVLVADHDGLIVGMIGVMLSDHPWTGERFATELFWWLEPAHRGRGVWLLHRAEKWAIEQGAVRLLMVSPADSPLVEVMYDRLGYQRVETSWQKPLDWFSRHTAKLQHHPSLHGVTVHDDVLPDPQAYRAMALRQRFQAVQDGAVTFQRMAPCADPALPMWIVRHYPQLTPTLSFFRQGAQDQEEPHFVHTDTSMGDWTAILYLTPDPPDEDGTMFWRHTPSGDISSLLLTKAEADRWFNPDVWGKWHTVQARFNRVVLFPAPLYHSRALFGNYGEGDQARLIQVCFGTGRFP